MHHSNRFMIVSVFAVCGILLSVSAPADMVQIKAYKEAFPGSTLKCINCHIDDNPKKDDGQHDNNAYGKAVVKAAGADKPTADTYKTIGKIEDFKQ
jgi:hypothetical protein